MCFPDKHAKVWEWTEGSLKPIPENIKWKSFSKGILVCLANFEMQRLWEEKYLSRCLVQVDVFIWVWKIFTVMLLIILKKAVTVDMYLYTQTHMYLCITIILEWGIGAWGWVTGRGWREERDGENDVIVF